MDSNPECRRCARLVRYRGVLQKQFPSYFNAPVPAFGAARTPHLLITGLAPGVHGANATGRVFTGDQSGGLLFQVLHETGFCNLPESRSTNDGMTLNDCVITNAVRCVPPQNRPTVAEIRQCSPFLASEISRLHPRVIVALGRIAHDAVLRALGEVLSHHPFGHAMEHQLADEMLLLDSYHCSRYNVQTGRLTAAMLQQIFSRVQELK